MEESLEATGTGDNFLNKTPLVQALRSTINKWDLIKLKSFCKPKDTAPRTRHLHIECGKDFTNYTSIIGLISKIYKEIRKVDIN